MRENALKARGLRKASLGCADRHRRSQALRILTLANQQADIGGVVRFRYGSLFADDIIHKKLIQRLIERLHAFIAVFGDDVGNFL